MTDKTLWASEPPPWTDGDPLDDLRRLAESVRTAPPPPPPITLFTRALTTPLKAYAEHLDTLARLMGWRIAEHGYIGAMTMTDTTDECDAVAHDGVLFISPRLARVFPRSPT